VLEVGCGLALAGLAVALCASPSSVIFSDREPLALHCALSSAAVNNVGVYPLSELSDTNNDDVKVGGCLLDWAQPLVTLEGINIDTVIGADVLYDPGTAAMLANACAQIIGSGTVVLCEPTIERALGCRKAFLDACEEVGATQAKVVELEDCVLVVATF
jgi:hypothetical protein